MQTTVDLDEDVLEIARSLAADRRQSIGRVLSDMVRKSFESAGHAESRKRNGVRVIQRGENATKVTVDVVNRFRDQL